MAAPRGSTSGKEIAGQPKGLGDVLGRRGVALLLQEARKGQQPVPPGRARVATDRAARFRRDISEIVARARQRRRRSRSRPNPSAPSSASSKRAIKGAATSRAIEIARRWPRPSRKAPRADRAPAAAATARESAATPCSAAPRSRKRAARDCERLDGEGAEMILEPRAPCRRDAIAGLKHGAHRAATARRARRRDGGRGRASSAPE